MIERALVEAVPQQVCGFCGERLYPFFKRGTAIRFKHSYPSDETLDLFPFTDYPFCPNNAKVFDVDQKTLTMTEVPWYES